MKTTVEDCLDIDVDWLKRHGYLDDDLVGLICWNELLRREKALLRTHTFGGGADLSIKSSTLGVDMSLKIVPENPCLPGRRKAFLCHDTISKHRKLYLPPGGDTFASRECHNLSYVLQASHRSLFYEQFRAAKRLRKLLY